MGRNPQWLYFDSKLTTYEELSQITKMKDVSFVTIRRRGSSIMRRLEKMLANGCYRSLASQLHGFDQSKPKGVYRKFVETSGAVEIESGHRIVVYLDRRSHNPILREANLDKDHPKIPWLGNHRLEFVYS